MEGNLLLEQYSRYKKFSLEKSPYRCLLDANIEMNPHQVNAFCAAVDALKTGGMILADEVGLGKTIEAGLTLEYVLNSGAKRVLIVVPAALRMQWQIEMKEKFNLDTDILDRVSVEKDYYETKAWIENENEIRVIITSYDYASKLIKRFPKVKWDFMIIDEAHNLRNVFHGAKRAKKLYDLSKGIPKILLTATPLQNSLNDIHGLVSYIDPKIFGSEKNFNKRFVKGENYRKLKKELSPVLYRTLRKDVGKYMDFKKRECVTVDFHLTPEESHLYDLVNVFLKRDVLYSIPSANRGLIILVIRKLLASSSYALVETFEVLENRLEKLYQGTKSADAKEGFDLFWSFVEDEMTDEDLEEDEDIDNQREKQKIQEELNAVREIITTASSITENTKILALKKALNIAFSRQDSEGIPQKAVVFTESRRTQRYIADELRKDGYSEEDVVLFNGNLDDAMSKEIYRAWQVKNYGNINYGRNIEYKHAIVDYFQNHGKVLITTDAGSEGLNLQFCNTVINYDLPWNPQKIEQRIGRCHRYGQTHDVLAINLLNTDNEADARVYEILQQKFELFDGVFGASDVALGALESGSGFEKRILEIYQNCDSQTEFEKEFDKLDRQFDRKLDKKVSQLQSILLTENPEAKEESLDRTKANIDQYIQEIAYWDQFAEPEMDSQLYYWQIKNWGDESFGTQGFLYIGAFCNNSDILYPVLALYDEDGEYMNYDEGEIIKLLEKVNDDDIHYFKPTSEEVKLFGKVYDQLVDIMTEHYYKSVEPLTKYNRQKLENWAENQREQLFDQIKEINEEVEQLLEDESIARDPLEKSDILKKVSDKKKQLGKLKNNMQKRITEINEEMKKETESFDKQFEINPVLLINIVLKF